MPEPVHVAGGAVDLSTRVVQSKTVAGSPATNAETVIATLTLPNDLAVGLGVLLFGWAAFTVGTSGSACNLKIRQTGTSGTTIAATGATTGGIAAANLVDMNAQGVDLSPSSPTTNQVYVLTLTVTAGAATSTVSAVSLVALVI